MKIRNSFSLFICGFSLILNISDAKKTICVKRQFDIENTAFYQRIEILNAVDCVERCIEAADSCRAVVYIEHLSKVKAKKNFCQFYNVNSEEKASNVRPLKTLEPTTTVFEILDVCPIEAAIHSRDFLSQLTPALKRVLDGLPGGRKKTTKIERELSFVVDDRHSNDRSLIFGHAERDDVGENRETYAVRPEYPFEGQKITGRKGTAIGKAVATDTDYTNDLNANGGDGGRPVERQPGNSITPLQSSSSSSGVIAVGNPKPISPVLVSHNGVPEPRGGASSAGGGYAQVSPSGYTGYSSIGTAGRLGQAIDCRNFPCDRPSVSSVPCMPLRFPTDPCIPLSASVERGAPYWSEWSNSGTCSVTCGSGVRQRSRSCSSGNDADCKGEPRKEEPCVLPECNVFGPWSSWSTCTASCNGGQKTRTRACRNGRDCVGPTEDIRDCNQEPCPHFSEWTVCIRPLIPIRFFQKWGECSTTCGQGIKRRIRECIPDRSCPPGPTSDHEICELKPCPEWGEFALVIQLIRSFKGPWQQWTKCSKSCGMGERTRHRECLNGLGDDCIGPHLDQMFCNYSPCPKWSNWSAWTPCSASCGEDGTRLRTRQCTYEGLPSHDCPGAAQDQTACQLGKCPYWESWTSWSSCSASCGHGQQKRTRECAPKGYGCTGGDQEIRFCQQAVCPYFDNWSEWSTCSASCGRGITERRRKCIKNDPLPGAVLPSEEELNAKFGVDSKNDGSKPEFEKEPEQLDDSISPTVDETGSLEANTESRNGDELGKNAEAKDTIKARLIERAQALKNTTGRENANGRSVRRPLLREHTLEVAQSSSSPFADRRRAPLKASMLALRDVPQNNGCSGDDSEKRECEIGPCCEWSSWSSWTNCNDPCSSGSRVRSRACQIQVTYAIPAPTPLMSFVQAHHDYIQNGVEWGGGIRRNKRQFYPQQANGAYATAPLFRSGMPFASPAVFIPGAPFGASNAQCDCPGKAVESEQCEGSRSPGCDNQFATSNRNRGENNRGNEGRLESGVARGLSELGNANDGETSGRGRAKNRGGVGASVEITDGKTDMGVHSSTSIRPQCSWGNWGAWNTCRGGCPNGTRARTRACKREEATEETYSTLRRFVRATDQCECDGENVKTEICRPKNCNTERDTPAICDNSGKGLLSETDEDPVLSCYWSEWNDWSECRRNLTKQRTRLCVGLKALLTDCKCNGSNTEEQNCELAPNKRPSAAVLEVSRSILQDHLERNGYKQTDERLANRQFDAPTVSVDDNADESFKLKELKDCSYLNWTEWQCDAPCGSEGKKRRTRTCPCMNCSGQGDAEETSTCLGDPCLSSTNTKKYPFFV
ncbi:hypothetical protein M3Y98_01127100 [Aphelenchoides besseyi]|nr:hypothetical protein M3Y98_01127100 [Aphelenchoides besseyi]